MNKFLLMSLMIGSLNVLATSYDYREKIETHCTTNASSKINVSITIQNETFIGWSGYPTKTISQANVKVKGKIDGKETKINEKVQIETGTNERIANAVEYAVGSDSSGFSERLLESLTGDKTTPGKNIKVYTNGLNINLVHGQGVGFVSLNQGMEHFETVAISCSNKRDTADSGNSYFESFQNI